MNRLTQYLANDEEPLMPEGDSWVVETDSAYWIVSRDTARAIERALDRLWRPRCRFEETSPTPVGCAALRAQLGVLGLESALIGASPRPIALIDLVSSGETLGTLVQLLLSEARCAGVDVRAVRRRLRVVGVSQQEAPHPKTWRWRTHTRWPVAFRPSAVKGVSIPPQLWDYLGNRQKKVARTNPPSQWGDPELQRPSRDPDHAAALRLAVAVYEAGKTGAEREAFAALLAAGPAMRHSWCRTLVTQLRR